MANEHVISLQTRLDDQAAAGFDQLASTVERDADRMVAAEQRVNAAVNQASPSVFEQRRQDVMARAISLDEPGIAKMAKNSRASDSDLDAYVRHLDQIEKKTVSVTETIARTEPKLTSSIGRVGISLATFAAGIAGGVIGSFGYQIADQVGRAIFSFDALAQKAEDLGNLSIKTNVSVEALQTIEFAASQMGVSFDSVRIGSRQLARAIQEDSGALRALGIATRAADGTLRSVESVLYDVADAYSQSSDETAKMALATKLFGRAGTELIPILDLGAQGLRAFQEEATRTGNVIDKDAIAKLRELDERLDALKAKSSGLGLQIKIGIAEQAEKFLSGHPFSMLDEFGGSPGPQTQDEEDRARAIAKVRAEEDALNRQIAASLSGLEEHGNLAAATAAAIATAMLTIFNSRPLIEYQQQIDAIIDREQKLRDGRIREAGQDDLPLIPPREVVMADRVAQAQAKQLADEASAKAAERHDAAVKRLTERLAATDLGVAKGEALAFAFEQGRQSVDSLMTLFKDNESEVLKIVEKSRELAKIQTDLGGAWEIVNRLAGGHVMQLGTAAARAEAIAAGLQKVLAVSDKLERREIPLPPAPKPIVGPMVEDVGPPTAELEGFLKLIDDAKAGFRDLEAFGSAAWTAIADHSDRMIARLAEKWVKFGGIGGDVIRALVTEALTQFARLAEAKVFEGGIRLAAKLAPGVDLKGVAAAATKDGALGASAAALSGSAAALSGSAGAHVGAAASLTGAAVALTTAAGALGAASAASAAQQLLGLGVTAAGAASGLPADFIGPVLNATPATPSAAVSPRAVRPMEVAAPLGAVREPRPIQIDVAPSPTINVASPALVVSPAAAVNVPAPVVIPAPAAESSTPAPIRVDVTPPAPVVVPAAAAEERPVPAPIIVPLAAAQERPAPTPATPAAPVVNLPAAPAVNVPAPVVVPFPAAVPPAPIVIPAAAAAEVNLPAPVVTPLRVPGPEPSAPAPVRVDVAPPGPAPAPVVIPAAATQERPPTPIVVPFAAAEPGAPPSIRVDVAAPAPVLIPAAATRPPEPPTLPTRAAEPARDQVAVPAAAARQAAPLALPAAAVREVTGPTEIRREFASHETVRETIRDRFVAQAVEREPSPIRPFGPGAQAGGAREDRRGSAESVSRGTPRVELNINTKVDTFDLGTVQDRLRGVIGDSLGRALRDQVEAEIV